MAVVEGKDLRQLLCPSFRSSYLLLLLHTREYFKMLKIWEADFNFL